MRGIRLKVLTTAAAWGAVIGSVGIGSAAADSSAADSSATSTPWLAARPVSAIIRVLGPPVNLTAVDARRIYVWSDKSLVHLPSASTHGGDFAAECEVRVIADGKDIILSGELKGNSHGCQLTARKLQ